MHRSEQPIEVGLTKQLLEMQNEECKVQNADGLPGSAFLRDQGILDHVSG
jgi:hypothetical protein